MSEKCDFGLIGLAVMGENLALNVESRGFRIAVFNRTVEKVDQLLAGRAAGKQFVGCHSLETRNPLGEDRFAHIRNRLAGRTSEVSKFLTGEVYQLNPPPSACAAPAGASEPNRVFADLWRRQKVLASIATARSAADIAGIPRLWDVH